MIKDGTVQKQAVVFTTILKNKFTHIVKDTVLLNEQHCIFVIKILIAE